VSPVKGARLGGLLARGLIGGATAVIVVVAALLTWPLSVNEPSPDQRRIADLQRLAHAIDAFRMRQHVLPASLARLPVEPAAPVHTYDPITNRPYDYRPLGPLAYELCARFDAAASEEARSFWWHDGGRYCFSLEARPEPKRPSAPSPGPVAPAEPDPGVPSSTTPSQEPVPDSGAPPPAPSAPPPEPPAGGGAAAPPGSERK
jgi:hypothetical protein